MKCITKYFKRKRLLKKYKQTQQKMLDQIHLHKMFADEPDTQAYFRHIIFCEISCYRRLKSIKCKL